MKKDKVVFNVIVGGLSIFHVIDLISKIAALIKGRTMTITTTNFIYSTATPILLLAIAILIYLIAALIAVIKEGKKNLNLYLMGAGGYSFLIFCDHAYRTRVDMNNLNFMGALIVTSPVIIGAVLLYYFSSNLKL